MLKTLVKKEYKEIFASYFVDRKTGKVRSTGGLVGMFLLYAFVTVILIGIFFSLASFLIVLMPADLEWLYFSVMSILSILLGLFGSVFNTYTHLYHAKDNEFLLSMPIKPSTLLTARGMTVYGMSLLYSGMVWLPTVAAYLILSKSQNGFAVLFAFLLTFVLAGFVTVFSCALGWVVALIASKLKRKNFVTVFVTLIGFGLYYFFCMKLEPIMTAIVDNSEQVSKSMRVWAYPLVKLGEGASGNFLSFLIFTLLTTVLFALCFVILSRTYTRLITGTKSVKNPVYHVSSEKSQSMSKSLFMRELKRFGSCPIYMMNAGLGMVILPVLALISVFKSDLLMNVLAEIGPFGSVLNKAMPVFLCSVICLVMGTDTITAPSISLEGSRIWILKTLPLSVADIFHAKIKLHVILNSVAALIATVLFSVAFRLSVLEAMMLIVTSVMFILFLGELGLIIGLKKPIMNWTTETIPVKQSISTLISILSGFLFSIMISVFYLILPKWNVNWYLGLVSAVFLIASMICERWLMTKGVRLFAEL